MVMLRSAKSSIGVQVPSLTIMTARLKNAIVMRLGLSHSWKTKAITLAKRDMLQIFHYNTFIHVTNKKSFFVENSLESNHFIFSHCNKLLF